MLALFVSVRAQVGVWELSCKLSVVERTTAMLKRHTSDVPKVLAILISWAKLNVRSTFVAGSMPTRWRPIAVEPLQLSDVRICY